MKIKEKYKSWKLDRAIRSGKEPRGRTCVNTGNPLPSYTVRVRSMWEEIKLWFRVALVGVNPFRGDITPTGRLYAVKINKDGKREQMGLISTKSVTDVGVAYIVDAFQNTTEVENMKYHDCGTGVAAEAQTDTALGTPYGGSRTSGTTTEGASANIYRTVGTINFTSSLAITEHGIFSAASAGTLLDRSVFTAINVVNGDAIEFTYELTFPAGS